MASKEADAKAAEQDDSIKQQLLDNPHRPLSLAQASTVYQLHVPPCAPLSPPQPQSQAPKACKPAGHPNCLHTLGYKRKGMWAATPPHIALLGSNPAASRRPPDWYAGLKNQGATCFSEYDTRVLTDTGFLFLSDIEARIDAGQRVLYACYDTSTQSIVYRPGQLVEAAPPTRWVDFTHAGTRHLWDANSDDYGSTVPVNDALANRLTLRTTPEHDMYVQLCTRDGEDGHESYEPRLAGDAPIAPHKQTARELAPGYQCECDAAGRTCTHGYSHYRMYTGAASGLHTPADVVSLSDRDPHSPVAALGLQSTDELAAFLELFGYWLGNGTMTYHTRADLASKDAVCFEARNNHDCVCLRDLLTRLHLVCGQHFSSCESDLQLEVRITEPRWFRFFDDEFGVAYSNSRHYDRRLAVPKQGMHSRQRRPSTSTASTVSASAAVSSTRARSLSESASVELVADYSGDDDAEDMSPCEADLVEEEDDRAASDKWLPDWVLFRLGAEQLRLVIEGLHRAAGRSAATAARQQSAAVGDKAMQNEQQICTSSVGFRDQLIHACMHAGYSAYFTLNTAVGEVCGHNAVPDHDGFCSEEEMEAALQVDSTRQFKSVCGKQGSWWVCYSEVISELLPAQDVRFEGSACRIRQKKEQSSVQAIQQQQAAVIATQPADLYDHKRDGRVWCVSVDHNDHLIFAQRAHRNASDVVTKVGRTMIVGQCYLNILVQSLYMNTHFRDSLTRFDSCKADVRRQWEQAVTTRTAHIPTVDPSTSLAASSDSSSSSVQDHLPYHLLSLFTRLAQSHRSFIDPVSLIRTVGVSDVEQQDAHEFRTYILQALEHALLNSTYKPHHTLLQTLFEGSSKSILRCQQCGHESTTASPFIDLTLPIKGRGSVYASMQSLCDVEQLEENAVYCSTCKAKTSMDKRLEYDTLPPYLNVQLMRFELVFTGNGVRKKKIGEKIYIPEKITMEGCLLKPTAAAHGNDMLETADEQQIENQVKAEKMQTEIGLEDGNGALRQRGGRRRGAVKDEVREELEDDSKAAEVTAEVVKDEEQIADETAMKEEDAEQVCEYDRPTIRKQAGSRKSSRGRGGGQATHATRRRRGKHNSPNGSGESKSGSGERGKGKSRRGNRGASIEPTDSAMADEQPHTKQNGHAEVIELDGDDQDVNSNHRVTRGRVRKDEQAALFASATPQAFDERVAPFSRAAKRQRQSQAKTVNAEETEVKANGHTHHSTSPSSTQSAPSHLPPSPRFDLSIDSDGEEVQARDTEQLVGRSGDTAIELDPTNRQADDDTAQAAVLDMIDDEEVPLSQKAAKNKAKAARKESTKRRKNPARLNPRKTKSRAGAKRVMQSADEQNEVIDVEDEQAVVSEQQEVKSEKRPTKRRRSAATVAAIVNSTDDNNGTNSTSKPTRASKSSRSNSSSSPPPSQSPTAVTVLPASVYSPDDHPSDYHLAAVLLHKGQYANHGHYTATLRDDSGCWWSFDDRVVTRLGERFYNRGGEVVIDAKEGKHEQEKQKETDKKDGEADTNGGVKEQNGDDSALHDDKETKPAVQEAVEVEVKVVVEVEESQPSAKQRGRRRAAKVDEQMQTDGGPKAELEVDNQSATRRSGRSKKASSAVVPAAAAEAADEKPAKVAKKGGRPKKSAAQKANADASGVDAKTKKEAERMYGPGGYSKDAYMLLYCNKRHPALAKLREEQDSADAELHSGEQSPTFLTVASHPQLAKLLIRKYHNDEVERENANYAAECTAYQEKRAVIEAEMERRRADVEEIAAMLQAQAVEVDKVAEEQLDTPLEQRAANLEHGQRTRFVSTQWLARFLTGWTEPEKEKKADAKAKKLAQTKGRDDKAADGKADTEAAQKDDTASSVIDISSDDDSSTDNNTPATAADKQQPTADEQADVDSKEEKSEGDKHKDEKEEDPGAIVVDHDVHISADGMEQVMKQAISQLDPGPLTESIDSIRCPHHRDKLSPHMLTAVKRVNVAGWNRLVELDGLRTRKLLQEAAKRIEATSVSGDVDMIPSSQSDEMDSDLPLVPSMALSDVCLECARSLFLGDLTRKRKVERVRQLLDEYHKYRQQRPNTSTPPDGSVWMSSAFVHRWKRHCQQVIASAKAAKDAAQQAQLADKQRELDAVQLGDAMEGVRCEHNELSTDTTARLWVSRQLWHDIVAMASTADAEMIDVNAEECPLCTEEEKQDNEEAKQHKAAMKDERTALRAWASKSHRFPDPAASPASLFGKSSTIYLLPQSFQSDVYSFLQQRDPTDPPRPHFSPTPLLCEHGLLKYVPRPEEGVIGAGRLSGTQLGVLVYCDEKVWSELKRYQYVDADEPGVQLQHTRIAFGTGIVSEQWASYELTSTPAVCEECVRKRQADEETGRTVFTKEDGGGIRVTTVATEEEAKSTAALSASSASTSASSAAPSSVLPTHIRPRRAAAARSSKQPLAVVEMNCASSDPIYQLKMELLSQSYSADWEPARQRWYWQGRLMDDTRTLADYGVVRGGEVKVWLGGAAEWDGSEAGRVELWSEGKRGGKGAAAERGFQGTALAMHARQHVQNAAAATQPVLVESATAGMVMGGAHDQANGQIVADASEDSSDKNRSEKSEFGASDGSQHGDARAEAAIGSNCGKCA